MPEIPVRLTIELRGDAALCKAFAGLAAALAPGGGLHALFDGMAKDIRQLRDAVSRTAWNAEARAGAPAAAATQDFGIVWNEARCEMLRREGPATYWNGEWGRLLGALNRLPGPPISSPQAVRQKASKLGIRAAAAPPPDDAPETPAPVAVLHPAAPDAAAENVEPAPASPPAAAASDGWASGDTRGWATEERRSVLRADWPAGTPIGEVRRKLEALPGPAVPSNDRIATAAAQIGLRRPKDFRVHTPRDARIEIAHSAPPPVPPPAPQPLDDRVEVARSTARPHMVITGSSGARAVPAPSLAPRPVPRELLTRDGAISVAALEHAHDERRGDSILIVDAEAWGAAQDIRREPGEGDAALLRRVNAARAAVGLPCWSLLPPSGRAPEPLPKSHVGANYEGEAV